MKLYSIYFSPTGGTEKTVRIIGDVFSCGKQDINLLDPEENMEGWYFTPEDVCLVAVPSFGGRAPRTAVRKLSKLHGEGARAVPVAVYGNRDFEDTLTELTDTLTLAGFSCTAAVAAVAEHSIMRQFGAGRPDETDREELRGFGERIRDRLWKTGGEEKPETSKMPQASEKLWVPGNRPYREYNGIPLKPAADKGCTGCGLCAVQCPVQAIPRENPSLVDKDKCISCMHCIAVCPVKARHNNKILVAASALKLKKSCGGRKGNLLFTG